MKRRLQKRWQVTILLISMVYFAAAFWGIEQIQRVYQQETGAERRDEIESRLSLLRSELQALIYRETYIADSLATLVAIDPEGTLATWPAVAERLIQKSLIARNVGVAPNDIIQYMHPMKTNESSLGFDLRTVPSQYATVLEARESGDVYVTDPVNLIQGGRGIIARFPIFLDAPQNKDYWGTVSVVMDVDKIRPLLQLDKLADTELAMRRLFDDGTTGEVFYGNISVFAEADQIIPIQIPNGTWQMAAKYVNTMSRDSVLATDLIELGAWTVAILFYATIFSLWRASRLARISARQDELTGLPNRRALMERLELLINDKPRRHFTLLNLDLNGFKEINDSFGHAVGDEFLQHVAELLRTNLRSSDMPVRIGGDEFLVILDRVVDKEQVNKRMGALLQILEGSPFQWHEHLIRVSASIGFAIFRGQDTTVEEVLRKADQAMYANKRKHREALAEQASLE